MQNIIITTDSHPVYHARTVLKVVDTPNSNSETILRDHAEQAVRDGWAKTFDTTTDFTQSGVAAADEAARQKAERTAARDAEIEAAQRRAAEDAARQGEADAEQRRQQEDWFNGLNATDKQTVLHADPGIDAGRHRVLNQQFAGLTTEQQRSAIAKARGE